MTRVYGTALPLVTLRPFEADDAAMVLRAAEDPCICVLLDLVPGNHRVAEDYVMRQLLRAERGLGASYVVADAVSGVPVGQIGVWLRSRAPDGATGYREESHGRAAVGFWTGPEHRRRGYASVALVALAAEVFGGGVVERLEAYVEPWNEGSWRALERAGFVREGLLRGWQRVGTSRRDMYVYGLLASDGSLRGDSDA